MAVKRCPVRIGRRTAPLLRIFFGVTPDRAVATLADGMLTVRFGWWSFQVPIGNIARWGLEGPWSWVTAIGIRRGIRYGDLSFAGSPRGGVRLDFPTPVSWKLFRVPTLYVGVEDLEGLAAELEALGIPGEDRRRG